MSTTRTGAAPGLAARDTVRRRELLVEETEDGPLVTVGTPIETPEDDGQGGDDGSGGGSDGGSGDGTTDDGTEPVEETPTHDYVTTGSTLRTEFTRDLVTTQIRTTETEHEVEQELPPPESNSHQAGAERTSYVNSYGVRKIVNVRAYVPTPPGGHVQHTRFYTKTVEGGSRARLPEGYPDLDQHPDLPRRHIEAESVLGEDGVGLADSVGGTESLIFTRTAFGLTEALPVDTGQPETFEERVTTSVFTATADGRGVNRHSVYQSGNTYHYTGPPDGGGGTNTNRAGGASVYESFYDGAVVGGLLNESSWYDSYESHDLFDARATGTASRSEPSPNYGDAEFALGTNGLRLAALEGGQLFTQEYTLEEWARASKVERHGEEQFDPDTGESLGLASEDIQRTSLTRAASQMKPAKLTAFFS